MDKLEKYYNLKFANDGKKPVFSVLSPDEKAKIKNSPGFAFWAAAEA